MRIRMTLPHFFRFSAFSWRTADYRLNRKNWLVELSNTEYGLLELATGVQTGLSASSMVDSSIAWDESSQVRVTTLPVRLKVILPAVSVSVAPLEVAELN